MMNLRAYGHQYSYKNLNKPVYKGLHSTKTFRPTDYLVNSIGQWPLFEIATKNKNKAMINSKNVHDDFERYEEKYSDFDGEILIFEIYLSG